MRRIVIFVAVLVCSLAFLRFRQPVYQGKRVGAWFDDLCSRPSEGDDVKRWLAASSAFQHMDSNAVPFLVGQLSYDASGRIEHLWATMLNIPVVSYVPE